tara:strand:- start:14663 stop:14830 length:168 start_codon:yes stop_codon:yes gene_type:complete
MDQEGEECVGLLVSKYGVLNGCGGVAGSEAGSELRVAKVNTKEGISTARRRRKKH